MRYSFRRAENTEMKTYVFEDEESARYWINAEIEVFKEINKVTDESKGLSPWKNLTTT